MLRALIFDVDGTLADTESTHRAAFNQAFVEAGLDWHWDEALYGELLSISGGRERIRHYWQKFYPATFTDSSEIDEQIARLHRLKTVAYTRVADAGGIHLRPGVLALIREAQREGLPMAIATTTTPDNIAALLGHALGHDWRSLFAAVGDAATAPLKKPHPQVYQQVLTELKLDPQQCIAFEDSGNGLTAATAAGIPTLITPTPYTADHDFSSALQVLPDLGHINLAQVRCWHAALNQN